MPTGILLNASAIVIGGFLGALFRKHIPSSLKGALPVVFGMIAVAQGIVLTAQVRFLPAVALALILGTVIGELLHISDAVNTLALRLQSLLSKGQSGADPQANKAFINMLILFCFSASGLFGALTEGMSGDSSILMLKSILDLFTAMIFATTAGYIILFIAIPQLLIFLSLFASATLIMPFVSNSMMADFKACGGIIVICIGLRMLELKEIKVMNMLPALVLAMPFSWLWAMMTATT
jgi:uncharacterized membrane protein YqgA involved in biofilm formation